MTKNSRKLLFEKFLLFALIICAVVNANSMSGSVSWRPTGKRSLNPFGHVITSGSSRVMEESSEIEPQLTSGFRIVPPMKLNFELQVNQDVNY